jgi:hypothetical protein
MGLGGCGGMNSQIDKLSRIEILFGSDSLSSTVHVCKHFANHKHGRILPASNVAFPEMQYPFIGFSIIHPDSSGLKIKLKQ